MFASLIFVFTVSSLTHAENIASSPLHQDPNSCILPPYPKQGRYSVSNHPLAAPGDIYSSVTLDISCDSGYLLNSTVKSISCVNGNWSASMPICVRDLRESQNLPACGLTTQHRQLEGTSSNHLELPWHVVVYDKTTKPYRHRCGGSLITDTKIISAAFCFHIYNDELRPASDFIIAANKKYSSYNDTRDRNSQYSDVTDIIIQSSYRGSTTYYEDNVAIVVVKTPFFLNLFVRPVCLDLDNDLDRTQLTDGNSGKIECWRYDLNNGQSSYVLNLFDFSYMKIENCSDMLSTNMRRFLTKDKFCARCNGIWHDILNIGNGIAFLESTTQRHFLRGVYTFHLMNPNSSMIFSFTSVVKHERFIKQHLY